MEQILEKRKQLNGIMLALKTFPELNKLENGDLVLEAIEFYLADLDQQIKINECNFIAEQIKQEKIYGKI
jgi:hypothetical protein